MLGTMAGGAADCQYWLNYLGIECRLHELRHKRRISVAAASKILANLVYSYKGMGISMGTMMAGVTALEGPALYYIDSDGTRLSGNLFCVGSGQTFAYGVLDREYDYNLDTKTALALGARSILAATHRVSSLYLSPSPVFGGVLTVIGRILWWLDKSVPCQRGGLD